MDDELSLLTVAESADVYNIKHRAFYFSKSIIGFIQQHKIERIYFSIFDQLLRAATSIGANLVEGVAGASKKDFTNFNMIALKSANETKYSLCLIKDTIASDKEKLQHLISEANEISKIIASIIINLKNIHKE